MAPVFLERCGEHEARLDSVAERVGTLEEHDDRLTARVTIIETRRDSIVDTFTKFLWPVLVLVLAEILRRWH
jgi:hypothetical protein